MLPRSKFIFLFVFFSLISKYSFSQASLADSSIQLSTIGIDYSILFPFADYKDRFGATSAIGIAYTYKNSSNWLISANYNFLMTLDVREQDIFKNIETSDGYLINNIGLKQPVGTELRGFQTGIEIGKILPVFGPNDNSGLFLKFGGGFLQHKIFFNYERSTISVPLLEGEYVKGYDKLCNGFSISQKIGYYHFSNSNLGSFHIDLYLIEAFTQSRRDWDFNLMKYDDKKRLDVLIGINIGLDIPIYKRVPDEFYLY